MGLFMHRDAASRASDLHPLPHAYRPPEFAPLSGEGDCEICGRERESIVHALQMVQQVPANQVLQPVSQPAPEKTEPAEQSSFHWAD